MTPEPKTPKRNDREELERAIASLRAEEPGAADLQAASDRVWQRLAAPAEVREVEMIRSCADVRALLPLYRSGTLSRARYLLLNDHLRECVACRHFADARPDSDPQWLTAMPVMSQWSAALNMRRMALVAAVLIVALSGVMGYRWYNAAPPGMRASVQSVHGALYRVSLRGESPVAAGAEIGDGESLRTPSGARAFVRLRDGSTVEMNEHAEFSVSARRYDTTVHLERGQVIVQAAHRTTGHLYVVTPDARVAVTGTVFSVNAGLKGSRVAVIEGEVRVAYEGAEDVLHSGNVVSTNASMGRVPVHDEIAWSQNLDQHLALLAEFAKFDQSLQQQLAPIALRYSSHLLPVVPQGTLVYASIPNAGQQLQQAELIFQQQMQQSPVLSDWWQQAQQQAAGSHNPTPQDLVNYVVNVSQYLGDEVVFFAGNNAAGQHTAPALMAEVKTAGLRQYLDAEAQKRVAAGGTGARIFGPDDIGSATATASHEMIIVVRPEMLIIAGDVATAQQLNAQVAAGPSGFASTGFGQRLQQAYGHGAGFLLAANTQALFAGSTGPAATNLQLSGFSQMAYIVIERRDANGLPDNHASFEFSGERQSIAAWLAQPAPMGSLEFLSPDASLAVSAVYKQPAQMWDDVASLLINTPEEQQKFANFQAESGVDLRQDVAAALGSDATFALDGAVLPIPSWKLVEEVYDPARLQSSLQKLVQAAARDAAQHGKPAPTLQQEDVNGQTFYIITSGAGLQTHYTFYSGYIIMAPSRALLVASMNTRQSGISLAHSASFRALLPAGNQADFSALLYQNLTPVLQPLASQLTASQMQSLQQIASDAKPSVMAAYGAPDRVDVASTSRFFGLDMNTLALGALVGHNAGAAAATHAPGTASRPRTQ